MRAALVLAFAAAALSGCQSCADLSSQKPFPCEQAGDDAVQCPAGWSCGFDGHCFDKQGAGASQTCADSDRHCADGWRCGAPADDGTRRCQEVGVGGIYPCSENADCEGEWRCGPVSRTCTEVTDQLSVSRLTEVRVDQVSPLSSEGPPSFAAVGHLQQGTRGRVLGFVRDGGLDVVVQFENEPAPGARVTVRRYDVDEASVQQLAAVGLRVAARFDGGAVVSYGGALDPVDPVVLFDGGVRRLANLGATTPTPARVELAALTDTDVTFFLASGQALATYPATAATGRPLDVSGDAAPLVLFENMTARWAPGSDAGAFTALSPPPAPRERIGAGARYLLVQFGPASAPTFGLAYGDDLSLVAGPCPACPFNAVPLQTLAADADLTFVARCPPEPGGGLPVPRTWAVQLRSGGDCSRTVFKALDEDEAPFAQGFVNATEDLRWRAHAGASGHAWYSEDYTPPEPGTLPLLHPVVLDRMPQLITRLDIAGLSGVFALSGTYTFSAAPLGLVAEMGPNSADGFRVLGGVSNAPQLIVAPDGVYNLGAFPFGSERPQLVATPGDGVTLAPPVSGVLLPLGDQRLVLVVSSNDTLLGAEVTAQLTTDAGVNGALLPPAVLTPQLVPAPGVPVRDVALGQTTSAFVGSRALGGFYVLARNQVFAVDVLDLDTWTATAIPLPQDFGPPRELWTEGGRGRVAFERGSIAALPTPVALAPPFPDDGAVAQDFARLCGDTLAVVGDGVRHFVSDAGWVPLPGATLTPAQVQAGGGRFFESGPSTFLATPDGRVLELYPQKNASGRPSCPP